MPYMAADTGNKVGFRPYASTNPQCAATLSGLGQNHPFKPEAWQLHAGPGLGEYEFNRPLDPWEIFPAHSGMHGLAGLGDSYGNSGSDAQVQTAADDLLASGTITQAEHDAILSGEMNFQDVLGYDPTDQASWTNAVGMLQQWNSDLQSIEAQVSAANLQNLQSGVTPSAAFTALTQAVQQQRAQYESLAQNFINAYRTVTGNVPTGLTGLGILPVVAWAIGVGAVLVAVYFGYQAFQNWKASINVQQTIASTAAAAQTSNTATNAQLTAALAHAQATGDTVTANTILATLQKTAVPTTAAPMTAIETWLTSNAMWLAIGAAGLLIVPNLFSSGRRR
jgi:hypothetical protein